MNPWQPYITYYPGDIVEFLGCTYICTMPNSTCPPGESSSYWGYYKGLEKESDCEHCHGKPQKYDYDLKYMVPGGYCLHCGKGM